MSRQRQGEGNSEGRALEHRTLADRVRRAPDRGALRRHCNGAMPPLSGAKYMLASQHCANCLALLATSSATRDDFSSIEYGVISVSICSGGYKTTTNHPYRACPFSSVECVSRLIGHASALCICPGLGSPALLVNRRGGVDAVGGRVASILTKREGRYDCNTCTADHPTRSRTTPPHPVRGDCGGDYGRGCNERTADLLSTLWLLVQPGAFTL